MSAYTKGPWNVDGRFVYGSGRAYPICEVPSGGVRHSGIDAANARLMAMSPELFEALRSIARNTCCTGCQEAALVAKAAIAKAEGK